jgi:hypothetical protein
VEDKIKFYEWLLFFSHRGMKKLPNAQVSNENGKTKVSITNQVSIKNCGPIHLLDPVIVDLSNTNNFSLLSISTCPNIEELNIANTPLISFNKYQFATLRKLNMSKTTLTNLDPDQFPQLEVLDIRGCSWKQFNRINEFQNLKEIIVDQEQFKVLSKDKTLKVLITLG